MKIACGTVLFRKYTLEKALDVIKAVGYEYVETQAVGPWCPHVDIEKTDPFKYAELVRNMGFKGTTAIWMPCGRIISTPESVTRGIQTIEWAHAANIPVINTGDGSKPSDMDDERAFGIYSDRMNKILETAEKLGVCIAIEPHGHFSLTGKGLERLMSISDSPRLGINFDACNIYRAAYIESRKDSYANVSIDKKENELNVLHKIINRVVHFHAKDMKNDAMCPLGEGEVKLRECFILLKKSKYDGAVSLETDGDEDLETSRILAKRGYDYLNNFFNSVTVI